MHHFPYSHPNILYSRIATDEEFLDRVMGEVEGVGKADEFTGNLWRRWKKLRDQGGVIQVRGIYIAWKLDPL